MMLVGAVLVQRTKMRIRINGIASHGSSVLVEKKWGESDMNAADSWWRVCPLLSFAALHTPDPAFVSMRILNRHQLHGWVGRLVDFD
jgi:hypothetical protein